MKDPKAIKKEAEQDGIVVPVEVRQALQRSEEVGLRMRLDLLEEQRLLREKAIERAVCRDAQKCGCRGLEPLCLTAAKSVKQEMNAVARHPTDQKRVRRLERALLYVQLAAERWVSAEERRNKNKRWRHGTAPYKRWRQQVHKSRKFLLRVEEVVSQCFSRSAQR